MDERFLNDEALAVVSGGASASDFPQMMDEFAWENGCANCPHRNIYNARGMCLEVYNELLATFSKNEPIGRRCPRRE